jgi:hypothetical protein
LDEGHIRWAVETALTAAGFRDWQYANDAPGGFVIGFSPNDKASCTVNYWGTGRNASVWEVREMLLKYMPTLQSRGWQVKLADYDPNKPLLYVKR